MTDEQINIAIAEACGWVVFATTRPTDLPDYCNDLNAMHEAEKVLTDLQCSLFRLHLRERLEAHPASLYVWHATASQRAGAFLRTIGKWEEVQP